MDMLTPEKEEMNTGCNEVVSTHAVMPDCDTQKQEILCILEQERELKEGDTRYLATTCHIRSKWSDMENYLTLLDCYSNMPR